MNNELDKILKFRESMKSRIENTMLKNKLQKLNLTILATCLGTEYAFVDKDKNIDETITEKYAQQVWFAKENKTIIEKVLKKVCDQINNKNKSIAIETISCADLNLESVSA
jgi:hypothetical protein